MIRQKRQQLSSGVGGARNQIGDFDHVFVQRMPGLLSEKNVALGRAFALDQIAVNRRLPGRWV